MRHSTAPIIAGDHVCGKTATRRLIACLGVLAVLASMSVTAWAAPAATQAANRPEEGRTDRELYDPTKAGTLAANLLLALHHANVTGNYSVLRDLAAPRLISRMTQSDLSDHFRQIRVERPSLGAIAGLRARFSTPPTIVGKQYLWLEGSYPTSPKETRFKIVLQRSRADWRFLSIEVAPSGASVSDPHAKDNVSAAGPRLRGSVVQE